MSPDRKLDLGSVKVDNNVLALIVAEEIQKIEGADLGSKTIWDVLRKREVPGVLIKISDKNEITIDVNIFVHFGINIPEIGRKVQDSVKSIVQKTLNTELKEIHVNVQGVNRGQK